MLIKLARDPDLRVFRKTKTCGQDSDHRYCLTFDVQSDARKIGVASQEVTPESIANQSYRGRSEMLFLGSEASTEYRADAHQAEEVPRDRGHWNPRWLYS